MRKFLGARFDKKLIKNFSESAEICWLQMERFVAGDCLYNDDSFMILYEIIFFISSFAPSCLHEDIKTSNNSDTHQERTASKGFGRRSEGDFYSTIFCFVFMYVSLFANAFRSHRQDPRMMQYSAKRMIIVL